MLHKVVFLYWYIALTRHACHFNFPWISQGLVEPEDVKEECVSVLHAYASVQCGNGTKVAAVPDLDRDV